MDVVIALLVMAFVAGMGTGAGLNHYLVGRHLIREMLTMKREGFEVPPKTIRPPKNVMDDLPTFRED